MSDRPRWWRSGRVYSEVKKCIDDAFLLRPSSELRNVVGACLGRAQKKYPVRIYWIDPNVNHMHRGRAPYEDKEENMSKFDQVFFSLLTKEINRMLDRTGCGTIWAGRNRADECVDDASVEQQLIYGVTNMVKDGLLDRVDHNTGYGTYRAIASGDLYERFEYLDRTAWHKAGGKLCKRPLSEFKKTVTVQYSKIPEWEHLTDAQYATRFRKEVKAKEDDFRELREREGRGVAGIRRMENLDPRARPKHRKARTKQPLCHASTPDAADEYQKAWKIFLDDRLTASHRYLSGNLYAEFPKGSFRPPLITTKRFARRPGVP